MSRFPRYAIYYAPEADSALAQFGASMLGYDAASASDVDHPADLIGAVADWHHLTSDPRNYGFHATLKPPMYLAEGRNWREFLAATVNVLPLLNWPSTAPSKLW